MTAFLAMVLDAYRELNAKKLFWITLGLSGLVVLVFGSIGFDEQGMSMLFGITRVDSEYINSTTPWARALYVGIFSDFIVAIWMSWIAIILALISTCTIFPDFLAGGAIDLVLSKPIHRASIFAMKFGMSLMFVVLQVLVFCAGIFVCIGLRIGEWNWMIFAAVPVVTVFYSYLFAVCVFAGVFTRSAITALLLTMLFWFSLWGMQTAEGTLQQFRIRFEVQAEHAQQRIERLETRLAAVAPDPTDPGNTFARADFKRRLEEEHAELESSNDAVASLGRWHGPTQVMMVILPKTQLTVGLLSRWLKDPDGFSITGMMRGEMTGRGTSALIPDPVDVEVTRRLEEELDGYSGWYIIGTSLVFEAAVLALACVIFIRRDF